MSRIALATALLLFAAADTAFGQTREEIEGALDFTEATREQIDYFEGMLERNGDMSAERQAMILLWLVDLYRGIDDGRGVERSYRRILAFFPSDVGVLNAYASYLMERGTHAARAESLLVAAIHWGRYTDARSLDRGGTYQLLARLELEKGEYDSAVNRARMAVELMDEESSAPARRLLAEALRRSGLYDDAARAYIDLIALERGAVEEDINALKLFVGRSHAYRADRLDAAIDSAIAWKEALRHRQAREEGAELVVIPSSDGVELAGTLRRRDGQGAALFIPDMGSQRSVFTPYAQLLGIDGISSLALDLRGQGASRSDSLLTQDSMPLEHVQRLPDDVVAGFRYLQGALGLEPARIVIVTEGYASPIVERALPRGGVAAPVVHLSPAFSPDDRELDNAIAFHPDMPVLLCYSNVDLHALRSCSYFRNKKKFNKLEIKPVETSGRGVDILRRDPNALESFQRWMRTATAAP